MFFWNIPSKRAPQTFVYCYLVWSKTPPKISEPNFVKTFFGIFKNKFWHTLKTNTDITSPGDCFWKSSVFDLTFLGKKLIINTTFAWLCISGKSGPKCTTSYKNNPLTWKVQKAEKCQNLETQTILTVTVYFLYNAMRPRGVLRPC